MEDDSPSCERSHGDICLLKDRVNVDESPVIIKKSPRILDGNISFQCGIGRCYKGLQLNSSNRSDARYFQTHWTFDVLAGSMSASINRPLNIIASASVIIKKSPRILDGNISFQCGIGRCYKGLQLNSSNRSDARYFQTHWTFDVLAGSMSASINRPLNIIASASGSNLSNYNLELKDISLHASISWKQEPHHNM
ncbi:hypothetical protein Glove_109g381 [Diversispora epigaea]|uniref:Uncharacterized protein n=1 Tax=Diversispora epigaea TaxID=1348612 RepID=A0A397J936_9GLOM|nr:hypothetical protein Glove_109g381 [Diversispora epigaea]